MTRMEDLRYISRRLEDLGETVQRYQKVTNNSIEKLSRRPAGSGEPEQDAVTGFTIYTADMLAPIQENKEAVTTIAPSATEPSKSWKAEDYPKHNNDMLITTDGIYYRWMKQEEAWKWVIITDRLLLRIHANLLGVMQWIDELQARVEDIEKKIQK